MYSMKGYIFLLSVCLCDDGGGDVDGVVCLIVCLSVGLVFFVNHFRPNTDMRIMWFSRAWPIFQQRMVANMYLFLRESKVNTVSTHLNRPRPHTSNFADKTAC